IDRPFEVYVGDGQTEPLATYLEAHPHATYRALEPRLRDLSVGIHGERAGDVLLLAHDGDVDDITRRYYFGRRYRSTHGSPSRADSDVPLIVANRLHRTDEIAPRVRRVLGARPYMQRVADLLLGLRGGTLGD